MFGDLFASIKDSFRHRFGPQSRAAGDAEGHRANETDDRGALARHNDAEARMVGRTMGDPDGIRAFGKGRPR